MLAMHMPQKLEASFQREADGPVQVKQDRECISDCFWNQSFYMGVVQILAPTGVPQIFGAV